MICLRGVLLAGTCLAVALPLAARADIAPAGFDAPYKAADAGVLALQQAQEKARANDLDGAVAILQSAILADGFAKLPQDTRFQVYLGLSQIEEMQGRFQASYDHVAKAGDVAPDMRNYNYWTLLCEAQLHVGRDDDAAATLIKMATDYPDDIRGLRIGYVKTVVSRTSSIDDHGARRYQLLDALWRAKYTSVNPTDTEQGLWFDLFSLCIDRGETDKARAIMATFTEPDIVVDMLIDKRFKPYADAVTATGSQQFNFAHAFDAFVDKARIIVAQHPDKLEAVAHLAELLSRTGKQDEAIKLLEDAQAKIAAASPASPPFSDIDDQRNELSVIYRRVLTRIGRRAEARASVVQARDDAVAAGHTAVNEQINLGSTYVAESKPQQALDELAKVNLTWINPRGRMIVARARACALAQMGDTAGVATQLAYIRAHISDGSGSLNGVLACTGDVDGLAAVLIAQLDDPLTRGAALSRVQRFKDEPYRTAFEQAADDTYDKALARPDVQAAIARYGFAETWPVYDD